IETTTSHNNVLGTQIRIWCIISHQTNTLADALNHICAVLVHAIAIVAQVNALVAQQGFLAIEGKRLYVVEFNFHVGSHKHFNVGILNRSQLNPYKSITEVPLELSFLAINENADFAWASCTATRWQREYIRATISYGYTTMAVDGTSFWTF